MNTNAGSTRWVRAGTEVNRTVRAVVQSRCNVCMRRATRSMWGRSIHTATFPIWGRVRGRRPIARRGCGKKRVSIEALRPSSVLVTTSQERSASGWGRHALREQGEAETGR